MRGGQSLAARPYLLLSNLYSGGHFVERHQTNVDCQMFPIRLERLHLSQTSAACHLQSCGSSCGGGYAHWKCLVLDKGTWGVDDAINPVENQFDLRIDDASERITSQIAE